MPHGSFDQGFCLGFAAGAAAVFLVAQLPSVLAAAFNKVKARSNIVQHLDNRGWIQRGREVTDDQLSQAEVLSASKHSKKKVLKIDSETVVKLAPDLDMDEVDNLEFIHSRTTIPVPKMLSAYEKEGCQYIDRESICSELREYLSQMRNIPPPKDLIGSVSGSPAVDRRSLGAVKRGLFACEEKFNEWQLGQLRDNAPLLNRERYTAMHQADHRIVFSHGDFGFHNIMSLQFLAGTDEEYQFCKKAFGKMYLSEFYMDTWFTREVKHGGW
ncbi:hypothetical protein QBC33DRAFT_612652 [Phialemonium atrogriseum]|uniref:Aminoglycoside phosphotransferase domain-containing protein n=1 Tax=Phialemonium atrogriseum TaxID=1093897 RepID=A0AAJ0BVS3_9PEZI|nr:uncharacterized protein QBC33DRAFT_612652 [Phialemonium atrogriseum]KAK1765369.1 hypothetical protein QBC33DRAFT_612652 [Phialemonium atrogriseum]